MGRLWFQFNRFDSKIFKFLLADKLLLLLYRLHGLYVLIFKSFLEILVLKELVEFKFLWYFDRLRIFEQLQVVGIAVSHGFLGLHLLCLN